MMKCGTLFVLLVVLCLSADCFAADTYTTKYDNINVDEILHNERLYRKYFECLAGTGVCTPDGKQLKELLPDALQTSCAKCTEKQKEGGDKVMKFVLANKPDDYLVLEKIYDPERVYRKKYEKEAEKRGLEFPDK